MPQLTGTNLYLHLLGCSDVYGDARNAIGLPLDVLDREATIPDPTDLFAWCDDPIFLVIGEMGLTGNGDGDAVTVFRMDVIEPDCRIRIE